VATPTEGGAMGATGALIMALARRRLSVPLLKQAMNTTAKLSTFVVFILVGARVFSLTFYGVNGHVWVEHLLTALPGGQLGFLIVVNILIFYALFVSLEHTAWIARAFFIWVSVFNLFAVSVFWSLMADLHDSDQGKRLFGFIAAGGGTRFSPCPGFCACPEPIASAPVRNRSCARRDSPEPP